MLALKAMANQASSTKPKREKAGPFTAKYSCGESLIKFTQFCDAFEAWCDIAYPSSSLKSMSGINSVYDIVDEDLLSQDSIIFGKLVASLATAGPLVAAAVMQHKQDGTKSGHLLFRDIRVAYWGGLDEYKGNIDEYIKDVRVNDKGCMLSFF